VPLRLVLDGIDFGPSRGDIGQGEGLAIVVEGSTTVMGDEIGLAEAGDLLIPIGESSDGNVVFEQGTRSCQGTAPELSLAFGPGQKSVNGCCAHMQELFTHGGIGDGECPLLLQERKDHADKCRETFAAQTIGECPEASQSFQEGFCPVEPSALSLAARSACVARNEDDSSARHHEQLLLATVSQDKRCIRPRIPCEPDKVIENLSAFFLACQLKPGAQLPDDCVSFVHGKPHGK